mgnify:CR=1 FL=1
MRSVKDFQETQKLMDEYKSYNDKVPELENKIEINNKKSAVKIEKLEEQLKMTYSDAEFEIDRESLQQEINNQIEKEKESLEAENSKVEAEIKENKETSKYFRTDANIKTITMEIKEMQKEVQKYKLEWAKKEIELQEFYAEGEEHEDPLKWQKIYKEKDELNKNINELTAKIEEYTKFKEELLSIELTADEYKKMFAREAEKQNKEENKDSKERTETEEEKEATEKWMNGEDIEKEDRTRKTIDPNLHKDVVTPELRTEPKTATTTPRQEKGETQKTAKESKEIDEVLQKYKNEGFGQNALGWYFNPSIDEYDATYDPHNDASYNPNIKKKEKEDKNLKTEEEIRKEEAEVIDNQDKNNNLPAKKENIFKKIFNKIRYMVKSNKTYKNWREDIENLKAEDFNDAVNSMSNIKNNIINSTIINNKQRNKLLKVISNKQEEIRPQLYKEYIAKKEAKMNEKGQEVIHASEKYRQSMRVNDELIKKMQERNSQSNRINKTIQKYMDEKNASKPKHTIENIKYVDIYSNEKDGTTKKQENVQPKSQGDSEELPEYIKTINRISEKHKLNSSNNMQPKSQEDSEELEH